MAGHVGLLVCCGTQTDIALGALRVHGFAVLLADPGVSDAEYGTQVRPRRLDADGES
jgi:hypothetical protein